MTTTHDVPMPEPYAHNCTGDQLRCADGNGCECAMAGHGPDLVAYTADQVRDTAIKYADARCAKLQEEAVTWRGIAEGEAELRGLANEEIEDLKAERDALRKLIDSPELHDFARGAVLEAAHQVERWGTDHDSGKTPADWFWLVGYLAGKALHAQTSGNTEKALHHTISTAAALANWHRAINGANDMRPGIDPALAEAGGNHG